MLYRRKTPITMNKGNRNKNAALFLLPFSLVLDDMLIFYFAALSVQGSGCSSI